jgi:hypothetical protein
MNAGPEVKNIVLVHGGFVDGSGWQGVYDHLTADGYRVAIVQNPTLSLAGDVAATHLILDGLDGVDAGAARCGSGGGLGHAGGCSREKLIVITTPSPSSRCSVMTSPSTVSVRVLVSRRLPFQFGKEERRTSSSLKAPSASTV